MAFKMNGWNAGEGTDSSFKKSYDQAYKERDMKTYGSLTKAEYIKEAKKQNVSKTLTGSYNAPTMPVPGSREEPLVLKHTATRRTEKKLGPKPSKPVSSVQPETRKQSRKSEGSKVRQLLRRTFGKIRPRKQK